MTRFLSLLPAICQFLQERGKPEQSLSDPAWIMSLRFLVDFTRHLNELNKELQGKDRLIIHMYSAIRTFTAKLALFENDIKSKKFSFFPQLKEMTSTDFEHDLIAGFIEVITHVRKQFNDRFKDFDCLKETLSFLCNPFSEADPQTSASALQPLCSEFGDEIALEICELTGNIELQQIHITTDFLSFWRRVIQLLRMPGLTSVVTRIVTLFGSTYVCEHLFSCMKAVKSKERSLLSNEHLEDILRIKCTSYQPNMEKIIANMQQQQSH